jgi:N-acyl-D-glutamate deacylase
MNARILLAIFTASLQLKAYDLVLANGRVMDPATNLDAVRHVGVKEGKIAAISDTPLAGDKVVDVAGLVVSPGFIDLHAHGQTTSDLQIKAQDGVTTALEMEGGVYPVADWYRKWRDGRAHLGAFRGVSS